VRYKRKNTGSLIEKLKIEFENINDQIKINDTNIYKYFEKAENQQNKPKKLERLYCEFLEFDKIFESKYDIYIKLLNELQFVSVTTPYENIKSNLKKIMTTEDILKQEIINILSDNIFTIEITSEIKQNLELYTSKTWDYFWVTTYYDENLNMLYTAIHNYAYLLSRKYFLMKKAILIYQEELIKKG